ncbi:MAG: TIR domain-containing protein [Planctomycetota bacterium]|nr:MAG: TIR domain-containing protein [Planctomycetota bacterium]
MTQRHKVFVSYHHANDEARKTIFELRFGNHFGILVRGSVSLGDIDPQLRTETIRQRIRDEYLRDSSVTVVLIGTQTWQRKHVDWEISSSIRKTATNPRSGLLGIFLPTHPAYGKPKYDPHTIPPRLHDNVDCGFAVLSDWTENAEAMQTLIHDAYLRKSRVDPDTSRPLFRNNRSGDRWS